MSICFDEIGNNTNKLISSNVVGIHKYKQYEPPTSINESLQFIGSTNFCSKFINKFTVHSTHFTYFFWKIFPLNGFLKWINSLLTIKHPSQKTLNTTHPFNITVDASLIGLGAILFQHNQDNRMQILSYISRFLTTQEQKLSTYDRELGAITFALSQYELVIIGFKSLFSAITPYFNFLHP